MRLAPTTAPIQDCPPDPPVPIDPTAPGRHTYILAFDTPNDWRGDHRVQAEFKDGAFAVRGPSGAQHPPQAVEQLRQALLHLKPSTDKDATSLPPRWHRNPKADEGTFAFGITHLRSDGLKIAYTDMAGSLESASPATQQVIEAMRQLRSLGSDWR